MRADQKEPIDPAVKVKKGNQASNNIASCLTNQTEETEKMKCLKGRTSVAADARK
jgi:hypothetical protein